MISAEADLFASPEIGATEFQHYYMKAPQYSKLH
jgi:hypothetical protein